FLSSEKKVAIVPNLDAIRLVIGTAEFVRQEFLFLVFPSWKGPFSRPSLALARALHKAAPASQPANTTNLCVDYSCSRSWPGFALPLSRPKPLHLNRRSIS